MKALKISYSRLVSKGNYENAKIEIELEVEPGEKAADVFKAAKAFVDFRIEKEKISDYAIKTAEDIIRNKHNERLGDIEKAQDVLNKLENEDYLPF